MNPRFVLQQAPNSNRWAIWDTDGDDFCGGYITGQDTHVIRFDSEEDAQMIANLLNRLDGERGL